MDCYFYTSANGEWAYSRVWLMVSFSSLHWWIATSTLLQMENVQVAVYDLWFFFIVSINGLLLLHFCKWRMCMYPCMSYGFFSLSPLMDWYFYTSANGERQWAVYASWFFYIISINGLLLLHFCKWRNGHVAVYASWFSALSPLMDCYFYTSANGEMDM